VSGQFLAPAALPPRKEHRIIYQTGGWVGPRTGLNILETSINLMPPLEDKPQIIQAVV